MIVNCNDTNNDPRLEVVEGQVSVNHLLTIAHVKAKILAEEEAKRFENYESKVTSEFGEVSKKEKKKDVPAEAAPPTATATTEVGQEPAAQPTTATPTTETSASQTTTTESSVPEPALEQQPATSIVQEAEKEVKSQEKTKSTSEWDIKCSLLFGN